MVQCAQMKATLWSQWMKWFFSQSICLGPKMRLNCLNASPLAVSSAYNIVPVMGCSASNNTWKGTKEKTLNYPYQQEFESRGKGEIPTSKNRTEYINTQKCNTFYRGEFATDANFSNLTPGTMERFSEYFKSYFDICTYVHLFSLSLSYPYYKKGPRQGLKLLYI